MIVTGFTDSRLSEVRTYDKNQPYQVGYKGVTNVVYDQNNDIVEVSYTIDNINYITAIGKPLFPDADFIIKTQTLYSFNTDGLPEGDINVIKNEVEMGISEPPKIESDIFIERQSVSVFERHLRMGEISSLDQLEEYKNGYYNIFKLT